MAFLKGLAKAVKSKLGADFDDARTKTGAKSKGRIQSKDKKTTTHLMGPAVIKVQGRRDKIEGGLNTAAAGAAGALLYGASQLPEGKKGSQADRKEARTGRRPSKTAAQKKADAKAERDAAFDKAFSKARREGRSTFTFRGDKFNTDINPSKDADNKKPVKKANGGLASAAKTIAGKTTRSRNKTRPRGVGVAMRGYGKALK